MKNYAALCLYADMANWRHIAKGEEFMSQVVEKNNPEGAQLSAVRQKRMLDVVRERGAVSVRDLCDLLSVSDATIRRDIAVLDGRGLVSRTHGGVVANSIVSFDMPDSDRARINAEEKSRIGLAAIETLEGGETVMIDAGTTALSVAAQAALRPNCTFVTTSLGVSQILKENDVENHFLVGGSYLPVNDSYCGSLAISAIQTLSFDVAFLCASAVDIDRRSASVSNETYAQVQREIAKVSRKRILLADHSKFRGSAFVQTVGFDALSTVISDTAIDPVVQSAITKEKLELILV